MKSVPPGVGCAEDLAGNGLPVSLSVLDGSHALTRERTRHRPTSLGDPDRLALRSGNGGIVGVEEQRGTVLDTVGLGVLEVWVSINTQPVDS